jgi:hypothetical protein
MTISKQCLTEGRKFFLSARFVPKARAKKFQMATEAETDR